LNALSRLPWSRYDILAASVTINILSLALPVVLLQVYDRIIPNQATSTFALLVLGVGSALILDAILRLARAYITGWAGASFEHVAGCESVERLLDTDLASFERESSGVHLQRLAAVDTLRDFYGGQSMLILVDLPFAALFLATIGLLAGTLVLVPLALLALFLAAAYVHGLRLRAALRRRATYDDRRCSFLIEVLNGIHTVKSLAMEALMVRRYERILESCAGAGYSVNLLSTSAQGLGSFFSLATMVSVVGLGSLWVIDGTFTVGVLAASTLLAGRSLQPLLRAMGVWTRFQSISLARERLDEVFALPPEVGDHEARAPSLRDGVLELENVHFRYLASGPEILSGVNLSLAPGEVVGITGENGCGKTTLLSVIMGALKPTAGSIRIDGRVLDDGARKNLRTQAAYLPQNGVLFQGTVMDNLTMFRGGEHLDRAVDSAHRVDLGDIVNRLPLGFDTQVGDGSMESLPGGIRQRIAIARALVDDAPLVLFDEANTSLDAAGDAVLRDLLEGMKSKRTIVLISHRPSLLKLASRVYELREGTLDALETAGSGQPTPDAAAAS
jgi:ATP-binding cassette subfamily C protein LapB